MIEAVTKAFLWTDGRDLLALFPARAAPTFGSGRCGPRQSPERPALSGNGQTLSGREQ